MNVRAKFLLLEKTQHHVAIADEVMVTVKFAAVYNNNEANADWSKYTPSGSVEMVLTTQSAVDAFELGKEYYLDFSPAVV